MERKISSGISVPPNYSFHDGGERRRKIKAQMCLQKDNSNTQHQAAALAATPAATPGHPSLADAPTLRAGRASCEAAPAASSHSLSGPQQVDGPFPASC